MKLWKNFKKQAEKTYKIVQAGHFDPATHYEEACTPLAPQNLPSKPEIALGTGAIAVAGTTTINVAINTLEAASTLAIDAVAGFSGLFGGTILIRHYLKCKEASEQIVQGQNMAGQNVEGTRLDLYCLHKAQQDVLSLTMNFDAAAPRKAVQRQIDKIINETSEARHRVNVISDSNFFGMTPNVGYKFVRPEVRFVEVKSTNKLTP